MCKRSVDIWGHLYHVLSVNSLIVKYTETKYWIRAHESYVIIIHLCTSSALHDTQVEVFFEKGKQRLFV